MQGVALRLNGDGDIMTRHQPDNVAKEINLSSLPSAFPLFIGPVALCRSVGECGFRL